MIPQVPDPAAVGAGEAVAAHVANGRTVVGQMGTARRPRFPVSLKTTCSRAASLVATTRGVRPPGVGGAVGVRPAMLKRSPKLAPGAPKAVEMRGTGMTGLVVKDLVVKDLAVEGLAVVAGGEATQDGTIGAMGAAAGTAPMALPRATTRR